jgi:protein gp37
MAKRLQAMGQANYADGFQLTMQEHAVDLPLTWKKPKTIFVNSMSDLFHKDVPLEFIQRVFDVMRRAHWHQYQLLTKRSERLLELDGKLDWLPNIWMGVSVENQKYTYRIDHLLGPLPNLDLTGIDWAIVGGESGPGARPMKPEWATEIRDQCRTAHVPFFFKQWGGVQKKRAGRELDGRTWDEMPRVTPISAGTARARSESISR